MSEATPAPGFSNRVATMAAEGSLDRWPLPSGDETFTGEPAGWAEGALRAPPYPVRTLLQGVADPVRTLELLRPWLDASPFGIVLVETDPDLTVVVANGAFRRLVPPGWGPVEGRPWRDLAPIADAGRLTVAVRELAASAQRRTVTGHRPSRDDPGTSPAPVWDVDLWPVIEVGGAVTHALLTVRDASGEVAAARRLVALADSAPELRQARDARGVLATAARHSRSLIPDSDALVVSARDGEAPGLNVVAAEGVWSGSDREAERELRMALVRDVVRNGTSIQVERAGRTEPAERVLAVPLLARRPGRVLGALAFARLDGGPFSPEDRLLVEEFAGRVGLALAQGELLSGPAAR
jgi:GAF domain-containing protein